MKKPEVGQIVWSLNVGNAAKNKAEQKLTPYKVIMVGRKYFKIRKEGDDCGYSDTLFHLDGWREKTDYLPSHQLFISEQQYFDEKEKHEICELISSSFSTRGDGLKFSLEKLRKIREILIEG